MFKGTQDRREVAIKMIPKDELLEEYRERLKDIILHQGGRKFEISPETTEKNRVIIQTIT